MEILDIKYNLDIPMEVVDVKYVFEIADVRYYLDIADIKYDLDEMVNVEYYLEVVYGLTLWDSVRPERF